MSKPAEIIDELTLLSEHGVRNTRQRSAILQVLLSSDVPLSAERIHEKTREADADINLSTVYRFLEMLVEKNLATKSFNIEHGRATFELINPHHRHHMTCTHCGDIVVIRECPLDSLCRSLEADTGFLVTGHRIELFGVCPKCQNELAGDVL
ncbi:MAG TPA: Fur family transcriptional regulator [Bacillota bacterium]|nr:Fur family transcriptional regulator [Bacillota bacterium]